MIGFKGSWSSKLPSVQFSTSFFLRSHPNFSLSLSYHPFIQLTSLSSSIHLHRVTLENSLGLFFFFFLFYFYFFSFFLLNSPASIILFFSIFLFVSSTLILVYFRCLSHAVLPYFIFFFFQPSVYIYLFHSTIVVFFHFKILVTYMARKIAAERFTRFAFCTDQLFPFSPHTLYDNVKKNLSKKILK